MTIAIKNIPAILRMVALIDGFLSFLEESSCLKIEYLIMQMKSKNVLRTNL